MTNQTQQKTPTISVILTTFNTSQYVADSINSLKTQTFPDFECLIIDDGSTDDTIDQIRTHIAGDHRFTLITKKNGGPSSARNAGLKKARGKYISFLDGDDWLESAFLEKLERSISTNRSDVSYCTFKWVDPKKGTTTIHNNSLAHNAFETFMPTVNVKLFNRNFLNQNKITFEESLYIAEDVLFSGKVLLSTDSISFINEPLLSYRIGGGESLSSRVDKHAYDAQTAIKKLIPLVAETKFLKYAKHDFADFSTGVLTYNLTQLKDKKLQQAAYTKAKKLLAEIAHPLKNFSDINNYSRLTLISKYDSYMRFTLADQARIKRSNSRLHRYKSAAARKYYEGGIRGLLKGSVSFVTNRARILSSKLGSYKKQRASVEGNLRPLSKKQSRIIPKPGRQVFIFAGVPFTDVGGGQRSAQLTKIFNRLNYEVHYIYGQDSWEKTTHFIEVPTVTHRHINRLKINRFKETIKKDDLVFIEAPRTQFVEFAITAKEQGAILIYENIDNWETEFGSAIFDENSLRTIIASSDILTGTSQLLVKQLEGYLKKFNIDPKTKKLIYSPNAVNSDLFEPRLHYARPKDLVIGEKTLIYTGSLAGVPFDWDLVFGVAKKFPKYAFNIIGDTIGLNKDITSRAKNVHFLGLKKQTDLPAYLANSDYAMMPFAVDDVGAFVSPLKIFEYISMCKPILSADLPDIKGYPGVYTGDTIADWVELLKSNRLTADKTTRNQFIQQNDWGARIDALLEQAYPDIASSCNKNFHKNISVIVLNYNNMDIIFDCIDALLHYNKRYNYEIIVVDNQSTDGSYEKLKKDYSKKIKLLRNAKNGGSSGRNIGIEAAKNDYVIFLDSDQIVVDMYWLDPFIEITQAAKNIGAIGWAAGWFDRKGRGIYTVDDGYGYRFMPANAMARSDIGYLGSGGMLIKLSLLKKIKGFDEAFDPTGYEDTDLSLKIRHAGKELYYSPYLGLTHIPHQTTKTHSIDYMEGKKEREQHFIRKWKKLNPDLLSKYTPYL